MVKSLLVALLVGCGSFQDPNVVVDLRVLAMTASPTDQVVKVDLVNPPPAIDLLAQLVPATVCALVADPNFNRRLRWQLVACTLDGDDRCPDDGRPREVIGTGMLDDPDVTQPEPQLCATLPADGNLLGILYDNLRGDTLHGLGGLFYGVALQVGGDGADPTLDLFAAKNLTVNPNLPADRTPNQNPYLSEIFATVDQGLSGPLPLGRCADQLTPLTVAPEQKVRLLPIEPDGVREVYSAPTIDGQTETFTESLTYQWVASAGSFSKGDTGGPHDPFGNPAPLFTDWTAPRASDLTGPTAISIWIMQRDERYGSAWYESCIEVVP